MINPTVIFSHGQESGPWGTKINAMSKEAQSLGFEVESIDYQGISDPTERVQKLEKFCSKLEKSPVLIGSSMGGYVATAAAMNVNAIGLFVLAPAYFMPGYEDLMPAPPKIPIVIVHGWRDDVVPVSNSIRFASDCYAELHIVDGDHRLTSNIKEINFFLKNFLTRIVG
tara:strand:- start:3416 stop:3922 length:507 start_codon:yes stop_codon:yes gene_type:complete